MTEEMIYNHLRAYPGILVFRPGSIQMIKIAWKEHEEAKFSGQVQYTPIREERTGMEQQPGITDDYLPMDAKRLLERLHTAINSRDLENLLRCFHVDYETEYPAHPERNGIGLGQVRDQWQGIFGKMQDFRADLLHSAIEGNTIWSEWHWHGGEASPSSTEGINSTGVIIFTAEDGLIASARVYMEEVEEV